MAALTCAWQLLVVFAGIACLGHCVSTRRKCKIPIHEDNIQWCLAEEILHTLKRLANGSKSEGLPPMDPVAMTDLTFCRGYGLVRANIDFPLSTLEGVSHIDEILDLRYSCANSSLEFTSHHPYVIQRGQYNMTGSFSDVFAFGRGQASIDMRDVLIRHRLTWRRTHRDIRVQHYKGSVIPRHMTVNYENLRAETREELNTECKRHTFNRDANTYFNENWQVLYSAIAPSVNFSFSSVFRDYMDVMLRRIYNRVLQECL